LYRQARTGEEVRVEDTGEGAAAPSMTPEQLETFYTVQYPRLVKVLVVMDATVEEAEDAVQKAMMDFFQRCQRMQVPDHPPAYVRRAAINYFINERQRERERLPRELRGGHLVIEEHHDTWMDCLEVNEYVEHLLSCLTPTQRQVIELIMEGLSTPEIAERLGKTNVNVRQQLKLSRNRLKAHPEIAQLAEPSREEAE
jgi:RNA polymerase sigma factor (sigma-70 family)